MIPKDPSLVHAVSICSLLSSNKPFKSHDLRETFRTLIALPSHSFFFHSVHRVLVVPQRGGIFEDLEALIAFGAIEDMYAFYMQVQIDLPGERFRTLRAFDVIGFVDDRLHRRRLLLLPGRNSDVGIHKMTKQTLVVLVLGRFWANGTFQRRIRVEFLKMSRHFAVAGNSLEAERTLNVES